MSTEILANVPAHEAVRNQCDAGVHHIKLTFEGWTHQEIDMLARSVLDPSVTGGSARLAQMYANPGNVLQMRSKDQPLAHVTEPSESAVLDLMRQRIQAEKQQEEKHQQRVADYREAVSDVLSYHRCKVSKKSVAAHVDSGGQVRSGHGPGNATQTLVSYDISEPVWPWSPLPTWEAAKIREEVIESHSERGWLDELEQANAKAREQAEAKARERALAHYQDQQRQEDERHKALRNALVRHEGGEGELVEAWDGGDLCQRSAIKILEQQFRREVELRLYSHIVDDDISTESVECLPAELISAYNDLFHQAVIMKDDIDWITDMQTSLERAHAPCESEYHFRVSVNVGNIKLSTAVVIGNSGE